MANSWSGADEPNRIFVPGPLNALQMLDDASLTACHTANDSISPKFRLKD
jgi:hypothetical protein